MKKNELNLRQQKFVQNYIISGNASDAALKAGYTSKHIDRFAYSLIHRPHIKAAIEKYREMMKKKAILSYQEKLELIHECVDELVSNGKYKEIPKFLEVDNKMQGHNAPEKLNASVTIDHELHTTKDITESYINAHYQRQTIANTRTN